MTTFGQAVMRLVADASGLDKGLAEAQTVSHRRVQAMGKRLAVSVTPAILGIGTAVLAATNTIDEAMATIRTGTGATGQALETLEADFRAVFRRVPVDA